MQGCKPGGTWNTSCGTDGTHNLTDVDPLYVSDVLPDLHLQPTSPAIDQGNNAFIPPSVTPTDLDGNPRIVGSAVDPGAYEFQSANTPPVVTNFTKTGSKNTVNQEISVGSLGSLHFTPPTDWGGTVSFGWIASDGKTYSTNPAVVTLTIFAFQVFLPVEIN